MFINSFGSLNAANMDYSIDVFLRQSWVDPRLRYNLTRPHFTITDPRIRKKIWKPDTYFNNVKDAKVHQVTMPNILIRVHKTGEVLYSMRATLTLSCSMDFEFYPFDAQSCNANISSYAYTDDVIQYEWVDRNPIDAERDLEIAQFDLIGKDCTSYTQYFTTGNFSGLSVFFFLRRQNGYHVLQTYVPTILIVVISWVSFWLDPNAVPGRVSLGVTTLLTLTTLASGIRSQLPPVSYVKAIDVWIGVCMIMVFGALLEFTFVNWLANKKIMKNRMPFHIPRCLSGTDAHEEDAYGQPIPPPITYLFHARCIDRLCRALFPGFFLVFNIVYWPYYLHKQTHAHNFDDSGLSIPTC
ncbi:hypothetical protein Pcinc_034718 [Petrolisthes cinctipes]|uniref:Uncharacterized protein n=1 Tax=Petrolisthes cinctipes TaxID=88211 RepID=A0AAE1EQ05_PETCI|nr:hypothetical protein Pcinc_034718 [Petrolisthes cinctipes]